MKDYIKRGQEIIDIEIAGLERVKASLDASFNEAVELMRSRLEAGGKIVVTGLGKSLHIGQKIAATLTSTGSPAFLLHPSEAMHGDLGILQKTDVLLALSYTGESDELLNVLPIVKRYGVHVIALTGDPKSSLAQHSDVVISAAIEKEACPFNMAPTASTTAALAMGDALAMVLLEARGFGRDDYAKLHPGGAIGRTLLLHVSDIMRKAERLASIPLGSTVKDAVVAMTKSRAGCVAVTDKDKRVVGIFTDGDLRRHIAGPTNVAELIIDDVMTPNPITLTQDHLAVDVLTLFEEHNIDDLIIVDGEGRLAGAIDIQDLPKLKIL